MNIQQQCELILDQISNKFRELSKKIEQNQEVKELDLLLQIDTKSEDVAIALSEYLRNNQGTKYQIQIMGSVLNIQLGTVNPKDLVPLFVINDPTSDRLFKHACFDLEKYSEIEQRKRKFMTILLQEFLFKNNVDLQNLEVLISNLLNKKMEVDHTIAELFFDCVKHKKIILYKKESEYTHYSVISSESTLDSPNLISLA